MEREPITKSNVSIAVENVGGIDEAEVSFTSGVTVLSGRNATNRTSFLRSIMGVLGSDDISLKGNADEGRIDLTIDGETYTRTLRRENGDVTVDGEPYMEDSTLADLFAFLLESNEARRSVARGDNLRDLIMRPVDTEAIQADIEELISEKRSVTDRQDELDELEGRRTELETERTRLESEIEETRAEREAKVEEIEEFDQDVEETREEKAEFEGALEDLNDVRSEVETVRFNLDTQRESLSNVRGEREEIANDLDSLSETPDVEADEIDARLADLRDRKQRLDTVVTDLQRVVQFNDELLGGPDSEFTESLRDESADDGDALTDQLVESDSVVCWTCGSEVESERIGSTIDRLRDYRAEKVDERSDLQSEISDLKGQRDELETQRRRRADLEDRLERTEAEIADREAQIETLTERRDDLVEQVEDLETEVETLDATDEYEEVLELHREANELEFTLDRLEDDLASTEAEIDSIDESLSERERLADRLEAVNAELQDRRTQIERIESEAVEHFNDHMDSVLDILDYSNIERIWIERTNEEVREGRRKVERSSFDLHVVRSTDSDRAYEDTIDHLSESEREVTGLVFALAGYLVHDVYDIVPFILLDSLEAIDSERIARLTEYIAEYADYLVIALLEEDAAALDDEYERVTIV